MDLQVVLGVIIQFKVQVIHISMEVIKICVGVYSPLVSETKPNFFFIYEVNKGLFSPRRGSLQ
jgi:hypothetical protein